MKIIPGLSEALGNSNGTLSLSAVGGQSLPKSISIYPNPIIYYSNNTNNILC